LACQGDFRCVSVGSVTIERTLLADAMFTTLASSHVHSVVQNSAAYRNLPQVALPPAVACNNRLHAYIVSVITNQDSTSSWHYMHYILFLACTINLSALLLQPVRQPGSGISIFIFIAHLEDQNPHLSFACGQFACTTPVDRAVVRLHHAIAEGLT
jgi:hypothetical protein